MSTPLSHIAPGVARMTAYQPGKSIDQVASEYGVSQPIKLASNENPLGCSAQVAAALASASQKLHRYPEAQDLVSLIARDQMCSPEQVTLGNGSNDVLDMVARVFLTPADNAVFSQHAFAVYPLATLGTGAQCKVADALPADHPHAPYGHDLTAIYQAVDAHTRVIFIANPNNPTGTWIELDALYDFMQSLPKDIVVVLDLAYVEYVTDRTSWITEWLDTFKNLVITRTFSKIFGLAGLRVGYGLSSPQIADYLNRVRHPFNVNIVATAVIEAALADRAFIEQSRVCNSQGMQLWQAGCHQLGLDFIPSRANFITVKFAQPAAAHYKSLLHKGVIVRPLDNYGLPYHLRITIGTAPENERALAALGEVVQAVRAD